MIWIILSITALMALCGASFLRGGQGAVVDQPGQEPSYLRLQHTAFRSSRVAL